STSTFQQLVAAYRQARNKPANYSITLPPFTNQQTLNDAARLYNCACGSGDARYPELGTTLHDYTVDIDPVTGLLNVVDHGTFGTVNWVEIPVTDRNQTIGDPHYIDNIAACTP